MAVEKGISKDKTNQQKTMLHHLTLRLIEDMLMVAQERTSLIIPDLSQKSVLKELHKVHIDLK